MVIKISAFETLEMVKRYMESSLQHSVDCTDCSPATYLVHCLSHHYSP